MSLRFLPVGAFFNLLGGLFFGFGIGFGASAVPSVSALASTGIGAVFIVAAFYILRPMVRASKAQMKADAKAKKDAGKAEVAAS
jgi:hypothetical protein